MQAWISISVTVLVVFWLAGMFIFRSILWLPWLALLTAVGLSIFLFQDHA